MNGVLTLFMLCMLSTPSYAALSHQTLDKLRVMPEVLGSM